MPKLLVNTNSHYINFKLISFVIKKANIILSVSYTCFLLETSSQVLFSLWFFSFPFYILHLREVILCIYLPLNSFIQYDILQINSCSSNLHYFIFYYVKQSFFVYHSVFIQSPVIWHLGLYPQILDFVNSVEMNI